jgi:hypothetical protein
MMSGSTISAVRFTVLRSSAFAEEDSLMEAGTRPAAAGRSQAKLPFHIPLLSFSAKAENLGQNGDGGFYRAPLGEWAPDIGGSFHRPEVLRFTRRMTVN